MKHISLLSVVGAALCILWACDPVDIDNPENGKNNGGNNNGGNNKNDSVQVTVDWNDPDWYTVNFWDRTDRQKAGLRGPVKKWHIDNYSTYNEYEYDRAGRLVREAYVNTRNEGSNYEWIYTYDAQGHLTKAECFDAFCENGEPCEYWEYEYENTGKYVAREWFMMGPQISDAEIAICKELSKASFVVVQPLSSSYRQYTYTFRNDSLVICEYSYNTDLGNDEKLNEVGYIVPGLGDAGDRLFGTI